MSVKLLKIFTFLMLLVWGVAQASEGVPAVQRAPGGGVQVLHHEVGVLEDPQSQFSHADLWAQAARFRPWSAQASNLGITSSTWWFRFRIDSQAGPLRHLVYSLRNPQLDDVRVQVRYASGRLLDAQLGDRPARVPTVPQTWEPTFAFDLPAGEAAEVLVSVRSTGFVHVDMTLSDRDAHLDTTRWQTGWQSAVMAAFASWGLWGWWLARRHPHPALSSYLGLLPLLWLNVATEYGFSGAYLFGHNPWWRNQGGLLLTGLLWAVGAVHAYAVLGRRRHPGWRWALQALMGLAVLQCVAPLAFPLRTAQQLLAGGLTVFPLAFLALATLAWRRNNPTSRWFLLGQAVVWLPQWIHGAWAMGWLPDWEVLRHALAIGLIGHAAGMAWALATWVAHLQAQKAQAERAEHESLKAQQAQIERLVRERTSELEHSRMVAMELALRDTLTGTRNRRSVLEEGLREFAQALRQGAALSVAIVDVDHFKRVNDEGGHAEGDRVLISIVEYLTDTLRAGDLLGRWGGEEFVILMPNTDLAGACITAERCRVAVEAHVSTGAVPRPVTVSIGVASLQADDTNLSQLMSRADVALYAGKAMGRNRVVSDALPTQPPCTESA